MKPHNVIITGPGRGKLIDFGFATGASRERAGEEIVGTFLYSAPEQTGILKRAVDARADLYALGGLLFECATGRPPFLADTVPELLRQHASAQAPLVDSINPEIGRVPALMIQKLLAKDPDDRYSSAAAFVTDLTDLARLEAALAKDGAVTLDANARPQSYDAPIAARQVELATLRQQWQAARSGVGSTVLLSGEAGVGKSRMTREAMREAATDGLVALGRCEQGHAAPLAPIRALIDELLDAGGRFPPAERERRAQAFRAAAADGAPLLRALTPTVAKVLEGTPELAALEPDREEGRFGAAVAEVILGMVRVLGPVLIVIEDAHWADDATARVLKRILLAAGDAPLLLLVTVRTDEASPADEARIRSALGTGVVDVRLAPLADDGVLELLTLQLGSAPPASLLKRITSAAHGNPFAVGELVRALVDNGALRPAEDGWQVADDALGSVDLSEDMLQIVVKRLAVLDDADHSLLARVAVLGARVTLPFAVRALGVGADEVTRVFEEAERAHVMERVDIDTYAFVHERVRAALLVGLTAESTMDAHQRAVDALLAAAKESGTPPDPFQLARHAAGGHFERNPAFVADANEAAGTVALASHAAEEAYELLSTARRLRSEGAELALLENLGAAAVRTGRLSEGFTVLEAAVAKAKSPVDLARVKAHLARALLSEGKSIEAWKRVQEGLDALGVKVPREMWRRFSSLVWHWLSVIFLGITGIGYGSAKGDDRKRRIVISELTDLGAWTAYFNRRVPIVVQLAIRQMHNAHYLGASPQTAAGHAHYAAPLSALRFNGAALKHVGKSLDIAQRLGDRALVIYCRMFQAYITELMGDTARSEQMYRDIVHHVGTWLGLGDYHRVLTDLAHNLYLRGHAREVVDLLLPEIARVDVVGNPAYRVVLRMYCASSLALLGRFAESMRISDEAKAVGEQNVFAQTSRYFHSLQIHLDQGELGRDFDADLNAFNALGVCDYHCAVIFLLDVYRWLERHEGATDAAQRKDIREEIAGMLAHQNELAGGDWMTPPIYRCHRTVHRAALERADGNRRASHRSLALAERYARQADSAWGLYEVARERARWAKWQGDADMTRNEARAALEIATRHGWRNRARRLLIEFELTDDSRSIVRTGSSTISATMSATVGQSMTVGSSRVATTAQRDLDSLLRVSLASSSTLDPQEQARAALDEVVLLLGAERVLLFMVDQATGELSFSRGRTSEKFDAPEVGGFSASVVKRAGATREAIVVTGLEDLAVHTGSMSSHGLKSIIAAPLVIGDRLVGVVYADSHLARGLFTGDDVRILQAVANHIAVALELARAARVEIARAVLEKDLSLVATAQSLFLPKSRTFAAGGIELAGVCRSADQSGGDFWWYDRSADGTVVIFLGDVTGHGAGPAMVTAAVAGACEAMRSIGAHNKPEDLIRAVDETLTRRCSGSYLMAFTLLQVAPDGGARVFGGGSPPVAYVPPKGEPKLVVLRGPLLGTGEPLELTGKSIVFEEGGRICLLSDGVVELKTADARPIKIKELLARLTPCTTAAASVDVLSAYVDERRGTVPLADDVTAIVIDRARPS